VAQSKNLVLVVDDDPEVRRSATLGLSDIGYSAEVAEDGKRGLELFIKHQADICLVLTDAVMPVMDGVRMAEEILELDPKMKILFMSGYSEAQLEILARTRFPIIRKPFLSADLMRTIAEMLTLTGKTQEAQT
jgi:CheY-like chemotaxis protein